MLFRSREYPQEQYLRDCKITHIYEGTNGIQAMDLLGRKLVADQGRAFGDLLAEIRRTVAEASGREALSALAAETAQAVAKLEETARQIALAARSDRMLTAFAHAYAFMEVTGDVVMAWMLLWRAAVAAESLEKGARKKDGAFYEGQIAGARFFIRSVLPVSIGKMGVITEADGIAVEISDEAFGGK